MRQSSTRFRERLLSTKSRRRSPADGTVGIPVLDAETARRALDSLPEGVCIANSKGEIGYINPMGLRMLGMGLVEGPPAVWIKRYGILHADGKTPLSPEDLPLGAALAGRDVGNIEAVVKNAAAPEGVRLVVSARALAAEDGTIAGAVVVVLRDETNTWSARNESKQRERYLHAILDNLPDIAWLKDTEGRFVAINQQFVRASGLSVRDILGKTDLDIWPAELAAHYRDDDRQVMESRSTKRIEEPLALKDGTVTIIETIKTAIVGESGEVLGTTGIARDITERKRAEDALRQSKNELEQRIEQRTRELQRAQEVSVRKERLAVLGQLAGGVAHQIRNPLAAIKNASYVLERSLPILGVALPPVDGTATRRSSPMFGERGPDGVLRLSPEQQVAQSLAIIHEEIRRANDIISGLLDYARIRAPVRQLVATSKLVEQVLAVAEIPERIEVITDLGTSTVAVDPSQVQEALHVLVRNAVDAMPDGGTLTISCGIEGAFVVVGVEDTGIGVPHDIAERLFEPLLTSKPMGLGLGLVTARTLVEAQGGQLAFTPRAKGARFEMRVPRPT